MKLTPLDSLGASGFGLTHFDIGGYTAMPPLYRTKEVFLRSAEAAVFTPVMRTHEGNRPRDCWQFYCNRCTMQLYARLVNVHNQLTNYIDFLMDGKYTILRLSRGNLSPKVDLYPLQID